MAGQDTSSQEVPLDGEFPKLGLKVRDLLHWDRPKDRLSVRVAARKTKLSHATIANMARGDRPSMGLIIQFAQGMKVDINEMLEAADYPPLILRTIVDPLSRFGADVDRRQFDGLPISTSLASAGYPRGTGEGGEEPASSRIESELRGIEVRGDCMEPFFHNGDIVFIRPQSGADPGQKVVALLSDDSPTCKVFRDGPSGPHLEATNGKYPQINAPDFTILGVIVLFMRRV